MLWHLQRRFYDNDMRHANLKWSGICIAETEGFMRYDSIEMI